MDISQIRKLIKLVQSSDLTEIEVTEGDHSVRISRQSSAAVIASPVQHMAVAAPAPLAPAAAEPATSSDAGHDEKNTVKSPMVGTYYSAPSPDADLFVKEGQKVRKGDVLCIIEAMKMMNEIEAEYDGVLDAILVDNASPIEYGQSLFVITPLA